jgi:ubiquinone/menaquinone biosynthesis C-methylase UbiE
MAATTNYTKHSSNNPLQKFLLDNFYKELFRMVGKKKIESVLDAGSGEGITLRKFKDKKIGKKHEGIEYMDEAIQIGKKVNPDIVIKKGDINKLPYADNSFDLVLCNEVLEHLENPQNALNELMRVSKKYLILSVPNEPWFTFQRIARGKNVFRLGAHPEHLQHWTHGGFIKFLRKNKLKVLSKKAPFAWTLVIASK